MLVGRQRSDPVLYQLLPGDGATRRMKFRKASLDIYSETGTLWVAEFVAAGPHAEGPIKVVIVKKSRRDPEPAYLVSPDAQRTAEQGMLEFAGNGSIEIAIRNAKTELGLGQARGRTKRSGLRVTNLCLWIQSLLILAWARVPGFAAATAVQVERANARKSTPSFADMSTLRSAGSTTAR